MRTPHAFGATPGARRVVMIGNILQISWQRWAAVEHD